jgi:hypothetical protein
MVGAPCGRRCLAWLLWSASGARREWWRVWRRAGNRSFSGVCSNSSATSTCSMTALEASSAIRLWHWSCFQPRRTTSTGLANTSLLTSMFQVDLIYWKIRNMHLKLLCGGLRLLPSLHYLKLTKEINSIVRAICGLIFLVRDILSKTLHSL